jgi:hypothetical protein
MASVASHIKLIKTINKVVRLNARQLINGRTVGNKSDEGIRDAKAMKMKYPGNLPGRFEKNLLYVIAPATNATPRRTDFK